MEIFSFLIEKAASAASPSYARLIAQLPRLAYGGSLHARVDVSYPCSCQPEDDAEEKVGVFSVAIKEKLMFEMAKIGNKYLL